MPTFYASGTTVRLSTAELSGAITKSLTVKNCPQVHANVEQAHAAFTRGSAGGTLCEDGLFDNDGDRHLRFLGFNQDMPFFLIRAGERHSPSSNYLAQDSKQSTLSKNSSQTTEAVSGDPKASSMPVTRKRQLEESSTESDAAKKSQSALCLSVNLSDRSYACGPRTRANQLACSDLKINVYFNGELTDSVLLNARGPRVQACQFSGRRMQQLVEKPWILNHDSASSKPLGRKARAFRNGRDRWNAVSQNLIGEIERQSSDLDGPWSTTGEYLESLTQLPVPSTIEKLDLNSGRRIGIIDVVITFGSGSKLGPDTPYLSAPTPLKVLSRGQATPSYLRFRAKDTAGPTRRPAAAVDGHKRSEDNPQRCTTSSKAEPDKAANKVLKKPHSVANLTRFILAKLPSHEIDILTEVSNSPPSAPNTVATSSETPVLQDSQSQTQSVIDHESSGPRYAGTPNHQSNRQPPDLRPQPWPASVDASPKSQAAEILVQLSKPMPSQPTILSQTSSFASLTPSRLDAATAISLQSQREGVSPYSPVPDDSMVTCTAATTDASSPLSTPPPLSPHSQVESNPSRWVSLKLPSLPHQGVPVRPKTSNPHASAGAGNYMLQQPLQHMRTLHSDAQLLPSGEMDNEAHLLNQCALEENPAPRSSLGTSQPTAAEKVKALPPNEEKSTKRRQSERGSGKFRKPSNPASQIADRLDAEFKPRDLDEGCKIGYADPGIWRQVTSKRGGWFKEEGVVMGVRFVLW